MLRLEVRKVTPGATPFEESVSGSGSIARNAPKCINTRRIESRCCVFCERAHNFTLCVCVAFVMHNVSRRIGPRLEITWQSNYRKAMHGFFTGQHVRRNSCFRKLVVELDATASKSLHICQQAAPHHSCARSLDEVPYPEIPPSQRWERLSRR